MLIWLVAYAPCICISSIVIESIDSECIEARNSLGHLKTSSHFRFSLFILEELWFITLRLGVVIATPTVVGSGQHPERVSRSAGCPEDDVIVRPFVLAASSLSYMSMTYDGAT